MSKISYEEYVRRIDNDRPGSPLMKSAALIREGLVSASTIGTYARRWLDEGRAGEREGTEDE